jgi:hypothetical protein
MKLVHQRRDETPLLPAESVIRAWAAEASGEPLLSQGNREALMFAGWLLGTVLAIGWTLLVFNAGWGLGEESAFQACSSWRLR